VARPSKSKELLGSFGLYSVAAIELRENRVSSFPPPAAFKKKSSCYVKSFELLPRTCFKPFRLGEPPDYPSYN
jgi:hypothetical protein